MGVQSSCKTQTNAVRSASDDGVATREVGCSVRCVAILAGNSFVYDRGNDFGGKARGHSGAAADENRQDKVKRGERDGGDGEEGDRCRGYINLVPFEHGMLDLLPLSIKVVNASLPGIDVISTFDSLFSRHCPNLNIICVSKVGR